MYERLVQKIYKDVGQLSSFVPSPDSEPGEESTDMTDAHPSVELVDSLLDLRDHTWTLYEKLSHIWLYKCGKSTTHQAQIRLSVPPIIAGDLTVSAFHYSFLTHGPRSKAAWRDVTVASR